MREAASVTVQPRLRRTGRGARIARTGRRSAARTLAAAGLAYRRAAAMRRPGCRLATVAAAGSPWLGGPGAAQPLNSESWSPGPLDGRVEAQQRLEVGQLHLLARRPVAEVVRLDQVPATRLQARRAGAASGPACGGRARRARGARPGTGPGGRPCGIRAWRRRTVSDSIAVHSTSQARTARAADVPEDIDVLEVAGGDPAEAGRPGELAPLQAVGERPAVDAAGLLALPDPAREPQPVARGRRGPR